MAPSSGATASPAAAAPDAPSTASRCRTRRRLRRFSAWGAPLQWRVIRPTVHKGWHSRNYLPHFDSQDVVQFVTFRLADSLAEAALSRLKKADRAESLGHE